MEPSPALTGLPPGAVCNEYQRDIFEHFGTDRDIVTSARTGAGKTQAMHIIANTTLARQERVAVLGIMKALADQKVREFSEDWHPWRRHPQAVLSGDTADDPKRQKQLEQAMLISATPEALLSKVLKSSSKDNRWVSEIGFLGVDEAHLIGQEGRGPVMETLIHTMVKQNPDLQVMLMSGTMPNIDDFEEWLAKLKNGVKPIVVESSYMPVEIERTYVSVPASLGLKKIGGDFYDPSTAAVIDIIEANEGKQIMVAVWNKAAGKALLKALEEQGIEARFHNGDVPRDERKEIEALFMRRMLNVLISTSTLFTGMNMPADIVIASNVYWHGGEDIPYAEIMQALGRAGRKGLSEKGQQFVLIPHAETEDAWDRHVLRLTKGEPVISMLRDPIQLATHFLGGIFNGMIEELNTFKEWYEGTLWSVQAPKIHGQYDVEGHLLKAAEAMSKIGMIRKADFEEGRYVLTYQGKVAAQMMLDPYHFADLIRNFDFISKASSPSELDFMLAYACCSEWMSSGYDNPYVRRSLLDPKVAMRTPTGAALAMAAITRHMARERMPDDFGVKSMAYGMQLAMERWASAIFRLKREAKMFQQLDVLETAVFFARMNNPHLTKGAALQQFENFDASEIVSLGTKGIFGMDMVKKHRTKASLALSGRRMSELNVPVGGPRTRQTMSDLFSSKRKSAVSKSTGGIAGKLRKARGGR